MIDSEALYAEWLGALRRNQNTEMFVRVGVWRDAEGRAVEGGDWAWGWKCSWGVVSGA